MIVLGILWLLTLWWAKRSWVAWFSIFLVAALIVVSSQSREFEQAHGQICWLVEQSVALRFFILFIGVMSCLYSVWDIIDVGLRADCLTRAHTQDTLARKVNSSDASEYATMIGCCGSRFWGASPQGCWLIELTRRRLLAAHLPVLYDEPCASV